VAGAEANVTVVRQVYDALNRRDAEAALAAFDPGAELDWSSAIGPYKGVYKGGEEGRGFLAGVWDLVEQATFDLEETVAAGEQVAVRVRVRLRGAASGAETEASGGHLFALRGGKVIRFRLFQTWEEALEAIKSGGPGSVDDRDLTG